MRSSARKRVQVVIERGLRVAALPGASSPSRIGASGALGSRRSTSS